MKKTLLLMFTGLALVSIVRAQCGDGINTVKTWSPPSNTAADLLWTNAASWSPAGVPDCDDDVIIRNNGQGQCRLTTTNVTVRDIQVVRIGSAVGNLRFNGNCTLTCRKITVNDAIISSQTTSPKALSVLVADTLIANLNADITTFRLNVKGKLIQNAGAIKFLSGGSADLKHVEIYGEYSEPNTNTFVRGNFIIGQSGNYKLNNGTLQFIDTGRNLINTAGTTGRIREFYNVVVNKKLAGAGDVTTPGRFYTPWTTNERWIVNNRLQLSEACFESYNTDEYIAVRDSLVIDASMSNNAVDFGLGRNGLPGEQGGLYLIFDGAKNGKIISNGNATGEYNIRINKTSSTNTVTVMGSRQEIGTPTNYIEVTNGILAFDGVRNGRINANPTPAGLVVGASGRLVAPDDDSLFFNGCWKFNNTSSYNAQNSTLVLDGTGNKNSFSNSGDTINLKRLVVRTARTGVSTSAVLNWTSAFDCINVAGDLIVADTCGAYFGNVQLHLEGNLVSSQTQANSPARYPQSVIFKGSNNQSVTLSAAAKAAFGNTIVFDKTSGSVTLNSEMEVRDVNFVKGLVNSSSSNRLLINRPDLIRGGNTNSYVNGPVRVQKGSGTWNGGVNTLGKVPVGGGGNYRPIFFSQAGNDHFEITYTASNAKSTDSKDAPIDEVSSTDLWRIDHVSGTSNYKIDLSLTGKPSSWDNTEVRIAAQADGAAPWYNQGGSYFASDNVIRSTNIDITKNYMLFTHGRDIPAPISLVHEGVSGREVATFKPGINSDDDNAAAPVSFNVYPNPVSNNLTFHIQNTTRGVVTLSDMSGKTLGLFNAAEVSTIDMSRFAPGMYLVNFTDGITRITHRVVKN